MKRYCAACTFLCFFSSFALAQVVGSGRNPGAEDPEMTRPRVLLSGRVVLDDGGPLAKSVVVQTICKGEKRIAAHTDSQGRFSFMIGEMHSFSEAMRGGVEDASVSARGGMSVAGDTPVGVHKLLDWRACGVTAELPGFISEVAELMVRTGDEGGDIGIITLRRTARVEGLTVSATSAAAPVAARKAFEKALAQEKNNKWDAAQKSLQKAVQLYPSYAVAWFELGRVQVLKKDIDQAKRSFAQSLAIDANYMNPYLELSRIEAREQAWQSLADLTAKSIALNSTASPEIWFFNGVANYNLQRLDDAEKSARLGLKLDSEHQFSKLEYLLGIVLEEKHQYTEAIEHMQAYLHLVNSPRDVEAAQKELAELSKLTGTTTISGATPPKN